MKKSWYVFVVIALIAVGLVFAGCAKQEVKEEKPITQPTKTVEPVKTEPVKDHAADMETVDQIIAKHDIYFDFDKSNIREDAKPELGKLAEFLKSHGGINVVIEGHCDERGTSDYNLALGEKRAKSTLNYLVSLGVKASRLSTVSYGKEKPQCSESSEECWQKNRRSHFIEKK